MFCKYCGQEITADARFCRSCGKSVDIQPTQEKAYMEKPVDNVKKRSVIKIICIVFLLVLTIAILVCGGIVLYQKWEEKIAIEMEQERDSYVEELNVWLAVVDEKEDTLYLTEKEKEELTELKDELIEGIYDKVDVIRLKKKQEELKTFLDNRENENISELESKISELKKADVRDAFAFDLETIEQLQKDIDTFMTEKNYSQAMENVKQWENVLQQIENPNYNYNLAVRQYDLSDFPKVKVYLEVTNQGGQFVDGLDAGAFYLNEGKSIEGKFSRVKILKTSQLNENEGISVGLVADVSGSMENILYDVQKGMVQFLDSLQFEAGDEVELTVFSDEAYVVGAFGTSIEGLERSIYGLETSGQTRLYDTLLSEIERVRSRNNAKCVVAFTDGGDNVSYTSADTIIATARQYQIPVFLIGVGNSFETFELERICNETGGTFCAIDNVEALSEIYESIYRQQKEAYLLEFETEENFEIEQKFLNIYLRTADGNAGKVESVCYSPKSFFEMMYNKFLVAGIDCQTKGERNLLDSGLITTTEAAYMNENCLAHQSQQAIDSGGVGSKRSDVFEVLMDYEILEVKKQEKGYWLYAKADYDISKVRPYSTLKNNELEREYITECFGEGISDNDNYWIEENRSVYEQLTLIKDEDGRWKFDTRICQRPDGENASVVNEVYGCRYIGE